MQAAETRPATPNASGDRKLAQRAHGGWWSPFGRMFRAAAMPDGMARELEALSAKGSVVFVMHSPSELNTRFVRWLVRRFGLPPLGAVVGVGEMLPGERARRRRLDAFRRAVANRQTGLIFMRRGSSFRLGMPALDPFPELVELQRTLGHPVYLVPLLFVWSRRPRQLKPTLIDRVFGPPEAPGLLATGLAATLAFVRNFRRAHVRMARPIDLAGFLTAQAASPPALVSRKVRGALYHFLSRETRAVLGPPFRAPDRVRDEVLRDRRLQETIDAVAGDTARPRLEIEREARRNIKEIAARMVPWLFGALRPLVNMVLRRVYDGTVIDEAGLQEVSRAATRGAVVLCPSHKSHFDYVVMSQLFYERGLLPPHIAAGINLAFWPFGSLARRLGAFFIRRRFRGERVYTAALRAYVKLLLRMGFPQEFFIEGGRSRTGKLLQPRTGLLSMEIDAWAENDSTDLIFVPVSIDYEKLPEAAAMQKELRGGEKRKEDLTALVGASKVLSSRHGRVYIQFGAPVSLDGLAEVRGQSRGAWLASLGDDARRAFVQRVANTITWGIGAVGTVSAVGLTAAALLADVNKDVPADVLAQRLAFLRSLAAARGARFSPGLGACSTNPTEGGPFGEGMALLAGAGLVKTTNLAGRTSYSVPSERRGELDFSRNNVLQHFIAPAIVACALRSERAGEGREMAVETARVRDAGRWLSRLLKHEFTYRVGSNPDQIFDEVLGQLKALRVLDHEGGCLRVTDANAAAVLGVLAEMARPFLEAYRSTAGAAAEWRGGPRKAFVRAAMDRCRADVLARRMWLPESVNQTTMANATEWLVAERLLDVDERGDIHPGADSTRARLADVIATIDRYRA